MLKPSAALLGSTLLLALCAVWFRPEPPMLFGSDAGCYARVAAELSAKPLGERAQLTLGGEAFFEHPPLAFWLEAFAFDAGGPHPRSALSLARLYATLALLMTTLAAGRLGGVRVAACVALSFPVLAGFLYESQNPMLEMAMTAWCSAALERLAAVIASPASTPWVPSLGFAIAVAAGFLTKGPPILALLGVVVALSVWRWVSWKHAVVLMVSALLVTSLACGLFELARATKGLELFFPRYFSRQVMPSFVEGRYNPDANPFFYVTPMLMWYAPAVAALLVPVVPWVRARMPLRVWALGATWVLMIVLGFTLPRQKYQWYIHPSMVGAAFMLGSMLSLVPSRLDNLLRGGALAGSIGVVAWSFLPAQLTKRNQPIAALQTTPPPQFKEGDLRAVADCSTLDDWRSLHLFEFFWGAKRVECGTSAPFVFDGASVRRQP
jgi:4-amino-4-deoxy-L-arabinose transferase-like glycosyltransferase